MKPLFSHAREFTLGLLLAAAPWTGHAASYIESRDAEDTRQRLYIDGPHVRIESDDADEYILIDLQEKKYYSVNDSEQQILDMSSLLRKTAPAKKIASVLEFVKKGDGPVIGGYKTTQYSVMVKGKHCFDEYLSLEALRVPEIKRFYAATQELDLQDSAVDPDVNIIDPNDVCAEGATLLNEERFSDLGVPMMTLNLDGDIEHEVVQIFSDVSFPPETFAPPAGYERLAIDQIMREKAHDLLREKSLAEPK